jgi:hypothetical protein
VEEDEEEGSRMGELAPTPGSYFLESCLLELIIKEEMLNLKSETLI